MNKELFRALGLSEGEIKAYAALLELGPASIRMLHERIGMERRTVYDVLNKLIERGLVSYVLENKRRLFRISHPQKIVSYIEEREHELEGLKRSAEEEIARVLPLFDAVHPPIDGSMFRGIEGMKTVWNEALEHPVSFWIGSGNYMPKKYPSYYAQWNRRRVERKAKRYNLYRQEIRGHVIEDKFQYVRYLPAAFSATPVVICVYGNKVANMLLGAEFFAFVIESKEVAQNYRKYFEYLWKKVAKP